MRCALPFTGGRRRVSGEPGLVERAAIFLHAARVTSAARFVERFHCFLHAPLDFLAHECAVGLPGREVFLARRRP